MNLSGVLLPLTTPFEGGAVSPAKLVDNIARYEAHDLAGYLLLGSTGEAALLDDDEKITALAAARKAIPAARAMMAGVGLESTPATVRLARRAADAGADLLLVITPFFFRSRMSADALVRHFTAVADASPVPILLYNVPVYTSLVIPPAVVATLASHQNIVGLKDSAGDLPWLIEVLARAPAGFQVLSGSVLSVLPALACGAIGAILAAGNAFPELAVRLHKNHVQGHAAEALVLQKALVAPSRLVLGTYGVPGVKAAMDLRGLAGGDPRPPLLPLSAIERATIASEIDRLVASGLLPRREV